MAMAYRGTCEGYAMGTFAPIREIGATGRNRIAYQATGDAG